MKAIYYLSIFTLLIAISSCTKNKVDNIADAKLTTCPENTDCSFQYANQVDFDSQLQAKPGNVRSFYYTNINQKICEMQTMLYFKTELQNNDFTITKNDIVKGSVAFKMICACCSIIDMAPIDGYIKGAKKDNDRWLIDAHVVLGTSNGTPIDTLDIRQYFTPLRNLAE